MRYVLAPLLALAIGAACDEAAPVAPSENPRDAGCAGPEEPRRYQVYFALDVSGSMTPFLLDVRAELEALVAGFPELDGLGRGVRVDYYVIAFVNDYKAFGGRMSSLLSVQAALDEAILAGENGNNLTTTTPNVEEEENLLDALAQIPITATASGAVTVVIIATDTDFVEAPSVLSPATRVMSTFAGVRTALAGLDARVHVFTRNNVPGLNILFKGTAPFSDLPGSTVTDLDEISGARERVRAKLNEIARGAQCDVPRSP